MSGELEVFLSPMLSEVGVQGPDRPAWVRLEKLAELWLRYGRVMNLTSAKTFMELAPHVLEAVLAVELARRQGLRNGVRWLDVGSGAGFPGLVIAALLEVELTLVEPRERRASFLEVALAQINRPGRVLRGHIDQESWRPVGGDEPQLQTPVPGSFDVASARAVFPLESWLGIASAWVAPEGLVFAHATRSVEPSLQAISLQSRCFDQWSVIVFEARKLRNKWG